MKKFAVAVVCTFAVVGIVLAKDTISVNITKVDGDTISYVKYEGEGKDKKKGTDVMTAKVSDKTKIVKGKFDKDAGKVVAGDAIDGGLKAELFTAMDKEKGVNATLTVDGKNATEILVAGGGKGGGGKGGDAKGGKGGDAKGGKGGKGGKKMMAPGDID